MVTSQGSKPWFLQNQSNVVLKQQLKTNFGFTKKKGRI